MNTATKALVFAIIAAFAGSTVSVTGKYALEVFHPFTIEKEIKANIEIKIDAITTEQVDQTSVKLSSTGVL